MRLNAVAALCLAGAGVSNALHPAVLQRSTQDAPQIKTALALMKPNMIALDNAIGAITKENVKTQVPIAIAKGMELRDAAVKAAGPLGQSKPVSITGALALVGTLKEFGPILNSTLQHVVAGLPIVEEAGEMPKVYKALKDGRSGIEAMTIAFDTQIPDAIKSQAAAAAAANNFTIPKTKKDWDVIFDKLDALLDTAIAKGASGSLPPAGGAAPKLEGGTPKAPGSTAAASPKASSSSAASAASAATASPKASGSTAASAATASPKASGSTAASAAIAAPKASSSTAASAATASPKAAAPKAAVPATPAPETPAPEVATPDAAAADPPTDPPAPKAPKAPGPPGPPKGKGKGKGKGGRKRQVPKVR